MNLKRVMDGLTRSGIGGGLAGVPRAGGLPRVAPRAGNAGVSGTVLGTCGAAAVGELAWNAYRRYQAGAADGAVPREWANLMRESFLPQDIYSQEFLDFLLLRAMITAAGADGHIDSERRAQILRRICILDLMPEEKAFLIGEIQRPMSMAQLVDYARSPDLATEIFAASALAVDATHPQSRRYLAALAQRLALPAALARELRAEVLGERNAGASQWRDATRPTRPRVSA